MRQFCICIHHKVQKGWATLGWYRSYLTFEWWLLSCIITVVKKEQIAAIFPNDPLPYTTKWEWSRKNNFWSKWSESGVGEYGQILFYVLVCPGVEAIKVIYWSIGGGEGRNCRVLRPVFHLSTICRKRFVHLVKCATPPPHLGAPHELLLRPGKGSIWQSHGFTKMSSFPICSFCLKFLENNLQFSICFKKIVSVALNLFFSISSSEIGKLHILIASHSQIKTYFPLKPSFRKFGSMHFSQLSMVNAHVLQMPGDLGDLCVHTCSSCPIRQDSILNIQLFVSNNQLFVSNIQLFVSDIQIFVSNIFKLFPTLGLSETCFYVERLSEESSEWESEAERRAWELESW